MNRQTWTVLVAAACLAACGNQPEMPGPKGAVNAAASTSNAPSAATDPAIPAGNIDALDLDFSGGAVEYMRANAAAVPDELRQFASGLIQHDADEDKCHRYPDSERVFLVDVDGDARHELLASYTLEGCGGAGGNDYYRGLKIVREIDGEWQQVAWVPLGSKLIGPRTVSGIEAGNLTVVGDAADPENLHHEPEVIRVPMTPES